MEIMKKELAELFRKKSVQISLLYLTVMSVLVGFSGPTSAVVRNFGTQVDRIPFAVIYTFAMMFPPALAIMVTCSVADGFRNPDAYGRGGLFCGIAAMWITCILAFLVNFLPCCLLWCIKYNGSWTAGYAPWYGLKLTAFLGAVILLTLCYITCCYMVSLLTKDLIAAILICLIATIAFGVFGASESAISILLPSGALFRLAALASKDQIFGMEFLQTLLPGFALTAVLCVWGILVYGKRIKLIV